MNYHDRKTIAAYQKWIAQVMVGQVAYVTLTLKQGLKRSDGTFTRVTREIAGNEVGRLMRKVDRNVFKSAACRHKKQLTRVVFREGGTADKHLHVHMLIEIPTDRIEATKFFQLIRNFWSKSDWSREEQDFQICYYVPGAAGYSFKTGPDAIDVVHSYLPRPLS